MIHEIRLLVFKFQHVGATGIRCRWSSNYSLPYSV